MDVVRLRCVQLPGVAILGISRPDKQTEYVAHAMQFVGYLKGTADRRACSRVFHALLGSDSGRKLKEQDGGGLLTAVQNGELKQMMYSYHIVPRGGGGSPSTFVTVEGMKEIMNVLPDADETIKHKLREVFFDYINHPLSGGLDSLSFADATPEQCARDDADEVMEEITTGACSPGNESSMVVTQKMWFDARLSSFESSAEKKVLEAQLQAKDYMLSASESMKIAEVAKERVEKELAQKELVHAKESASKDIQIARLQMQMELAEEKAKLRAEFEAGRLERDEGRDKVRRLGLTKLNPKEVFFARLISTIWGNDIAGVNSFSKKMATHDSNVLPPEPITVMPQLIAHSSGGSVGSFFMHRAFGFCFRGSAISEETLQKFDYIKEAFGVEVGGIQFVCIVFFKSASRQRFLTSTLPYAVGLLPCTTMVEQIPGRNYHLAVYNAGVATDDPVLEQLKKPSASKWFWHSCARRDV
jgi:hypothetical protein